MAEVDTPTPPTLELQTLVLPCSPENLAKAEDFVDSFAGTLLRDPLSRTRVLAASSEAASNAVDHGSSLSPQMDFVVGLGTSRACLVILVRDFGGKTFDPEYFENVSQRKTWGLTGGRGILLISRSMDEVMFLFDEKRATTLCMVKYLDD